MKDLGGCIVGATFLLVVIVIAVSLLGAAVAQVAGTCDLNRTIHVNGVIPYDTDECYYQNRPSALFGGQ